MNNPISPPNRARPIFINAQMGKTHSVMLPQVCRYLPKNFVDDFFESGKLRLSSFAKFHKHEDEQRGDSNEGNTVLDTTIGDQTVIAGYTVGKDAYVMSTSLLCSSKIKEEFGCDDAFEIHDPLNFASAVSTEIAGFMGGIQGVCMYLPRKVWGYNLEGITLEGVETKPLIIPISTTGENLEVKEIVNPEVAEKLAKQMSGPALLFLKEAKFSHQIEYRFVWGINKNTQEHIDIVCPDAIKFCRRVPKDQFI